MTLAASPPTVPGAAPASGRWVEVCPLEALDPDRGGAALVGGHQVALFRLAGPGAGVPALAEPGLARPGGPPSQEETGVEASEEIYAVGNRDPFCGANVIARGIVGSAGATTYVASPMHKQRFDLRTGRCLDEEAVAIPVWPARVVDGRVELLVTEPGA